MRVSKTFLAIIIGAVLFFAGFGILMAVGLNHEQATHFSPVGQTSEESVVLTQDFLHREYDAYVSSQKPTGTMSNVMLVIGILAVVIMILVLAVKLTRHTFSGSDLAYVIPVIAVGVILILLSLLFGSSYRKMMRNKDEPIALKKVSVTHMEERQSHYTDGDGTVSSTSYYYVTIDGVEKLFSKDDYDRFESGKEYYAAKAGNNLTFRYYPVDKFVTE